MPDQPSRRSITLTEPGEIGYRKGVTTYAEFDRLIREKPHPPPCAHPFTATGWDITTCRHVRSGLLIVHTYACPHCGELVATIHTPLKEILR